MSVISMYLLHVILYFTVLRNIQYILPNNLEKSQKWF